MNRAYPGATFAPTFTVTTGGTFSATVTDALGGKVASSVSEASGTATLTVASGAWSNSSPGLGKIFITREDSGVKTVEVSENYRILAGPLDLVVLDYA